MVDGRKMVRPRSLLVLRALALLALAVSTALLVDYLRPQPAFCQAGGGCDVVKHRYGFLGGVVPIPLLGVLGFAGVFGLSIARKGQKIAALAAIGGGLVAMGLLVTQAIVIKTFCVLCVITDVAAMGAGIAGVFLFRSRVTVEDAWPAMAWVALAFAALAVPPTWSLTRPAPPIPPSIVATWVPGKLNVVEFSDFECPFCRMAHEPLKKALATSPIPVHLVRKTMPLPMHPHAREASRAWICADEQGKGEAMADALFSANDLTAEGCEKLASELGLDIRRYHACVGDRTTEARIAADVKFVQGADYKGLPTVYIGSEKVLGAHEQPDYEAAVAIAASGKSSGEGKWWPFAGVLVAAIGMFAVGMQGRRAET